MKERIRAAEAPGSGGSGALTHSDALSTSAEMPTIARVSWSFTRVVAGGCVDVFRGHPSTIETGDHPSGQGAAVTNTSGSRPGRRPGSSRTIFGAAQASPTHSVDVTRWTMPPVPHPDGTSRGALKVSSSADERYFSCRLRYSATS